MNTKSFNKSLGDLVSCEFPQKMDFLRECVWNYISNKEFLEYMDNRLTEYLGALMYEMVKKNEIECGVDLEGNIRFWEKNQGE